MGLIDCVHVAPGPFSVYRANLLKSLGGFDENNITEDLEISFTLIFPQNILLLRKLLFLH